MESAVLFRAAFFSILQYSIGKNSVFLKIGPHSAFDGSARQILTQESSKASYISTLIRNQDCVKSLLFAVGKLYTLQMSIDLKALILNGSCLSDLPVYS